MAVCPDCRHRMQPFYVPAKQGGGEVELDRCGHCSALWFNEGELEAVLGKTVRRRQGVSSRSCPSCRVALEAAVLEGKVEVERCGSCKGVFLDGRDVAGLGKGTRERPKSGSGFLCEACGERKPFGEAVSTVTGLICGGCAKANEPEPLAEEEKRSGLGRLMAWLTS